jgi:hypothetical protein
MLFYSTARSTQVITPTNHCSFSRIGERLSGGCGKIFGETPTMTLAPVPAITSGAWVPGRKPVAAWSGERTYLRYSNAPIELEEFAAGTGILRTQDGWFAVTGIKANSSSLRFGLDMSGEVAPNDADRAIIQRAAKILSSANVWNRDDQPIANECPTGETTWSISCAMVQATVDVTGGFHHRRPAMELVRIIIEQRTAGRRYRHRLLDYNNDPTTKFADVQSLFAEALQRAGDNAWLKRHGFL